MSDTLNQSIAAKIERIATTAIKEISQCAKRPGGDDTVDAKTFDKVLRRQEGVLPRSATLLGPQSEKRYLKGPLTRSGNGQFRPSDAKG